MINSIQYFRENYIHIEDEIQIRIAQILDNFVKSLVKSTRIWTGDHDSEIALDKQV